MFSEFLLNCDQFLSGFCQNAVTFTELPRSFHGAFTEPSRRISDRYQFRRTLHAPRCPLFSARSCAQPVQRPLDWRPGDSSPRTDVARRKDDEARGKKRWQKVDQRRALCSKLQASTHLAGFSRSFDEDICRALDRGLRSKKIVHLKIQNISKELSFTNF